MTKRELSSTLRSLKFMQRATPREEKVKVEVVKPEPEGSFLGVSGISASSTASRRCIVIVEGDPQPAALKGRMSFQSFNPTIDKLNEGTAILHQTQPSNTSNHDADISNRLQENLVVRSEESKGSNQGNNTDAEDLKRNESAEELEIPAPNKSQKIKNVDANGSSSPHNRSSSDKKQKNEKLNWNLLRPPKAKKKKT